MVKPVSEEPEVVLVHWGIMRDPFGYRLLGYRHDTLRGRISSPIAAMDLGTMTLETESGRIYRLHGPSNWFAAATVMAAHSMRWGASGGELADLQEAALSLVPKPAGGWN